MKIDPKDVEEAMITSTEANQERELRNWSDLPALANVEELAAFIRISKKTVYDLLSERDIPGARKVGREWRVSTEALRSWFQAGSDSS